MLNPATAPDIKAIIGSLFWVMYRNKQSIPLYDEIKIDMNSANDVVSLPPSFKSNSGFLNIFPESILGTSPRPYFRAYVITNDLKIAKKQLDVHVPLCLQNLLAAEFNSRCLRLSTLSCRNRS